MTTTEQESKTKEKIGKGLVLVITGILEEAESAPESNLGIHSYLSLKVAEANCYISEARKYGVESEEFEYLLGRRDILIKKMQELERK